MCDRSGGVIRLIREAGLCGVGHGFTGRGPLMDRHSKLGHIGRELDTSPAILTCDRGRKEVGVARLGAGELVQNVLWERAQGSRRPLLGKKA